ncbi:MAG: phosphatase PAP2 family protein [Anaerovoracaceae bacterium]|jgi:undecaprenyl-diphosphatase
MGFDWSILHWIQENMHNWLLDTVMPKITFLGDMGMIWIAAAILLICIKKYRRYGVLLLIGLAAGVVIGNLCLKNLIARPRPCWLDQSVHMLVSRPADYSFPSGHTLSAVIAATILTAADKHFGLAAIPLAALIAFSRLYLYVHFPSDILGAVLIGLLIGFVLLYVSGEWKHGGQNNRRLRPATLPPAAKNDMPAPRT